MYINIYRTYLYAWRRCEHLAVGTAEQQSGTEVALAHQHIVYKCLPSSAIVEAYMYMQVNIYIYTHIGIHTYINEYV